MNLLPFLARVLDQFPDVLVMAAGGIASGRALAAVLAAGAEGAWVGTAFLATSETPEVPDTYKERVIQSDGEDTIYTRVYDLLDEIEAPPWPQGIAGRVYHNDFVQEWQGHEDELQRRREELALECGRAWERHDTQIAAVYMGQSATSVDAIRPAAEVLRDICDQAERVLHERSRSLVR